MASSVLPGTNIIILSVPKRVLQRYPPQGRHINSNGYTNEKLSGIQGIVYDKVHLVLCTRLGPTKGPNYK